MNIGNLAIYKGKAAVITAVGKDKIDIRTSEGKSVSVRMKDLELLHRGQVSSLNFPEPPQPDWLELAELADENGFSFEEFTELAYGENTPAAAWYAWCVLNEGIYFVGSPGAGVKLQTPEKREELLRKQEEKEAKKRQRAELLERIRSNALLSDDLKYLCEIEAVGNGKSENSSLMRDLDIEAVPAKAHALLCRLGAWDELYDPWPPRLGVDITMPAAALGEFDPQEPREDLTGHICYAIDDVSSKDPDDAIAFCDGLLYVHIADPAAVVTPGSEADEEASWRGESSYLPEINSPMLPPDSIEKFGLGLSEKSPAVTFVVRIDDEGYAHLEKLSLSLVHAERHSYESAAVSLMETPEFTAMREALERFRKRRMADGAVFIKLPEVKTRLVAGEISFSPCPVTPERELVANAMLCAGAATAAFMNEKCIPFPYVTQAPPDIDMDTLGDSLVDMFQLRRNCSTGVTGVAAGKHAGLGLEPYSRVTSPLRRYADLLAHQQIRRYLKNEPLLDLEYIEKRLVRADEAGGMRHKLEKYANEYFLLHYLKRNPQWQGRGTVVEKQGERLTVLIPEFAYCAKCRFNGGIREGDEVELLCNASDPVELKVHFQVKKIQESDSKSGL